MVLQTFVVGHRRDGAFARLLLDHGADTTIRASLRKRLRFVADKTMHEYRLVTATEWGELFRERSWVNESVIKLLREP